MEQKQPNVIWEPQPRQYAFMERPEYEALYGGAAGGGKSDALIAEALRQVHIPHYRGLILRNTFPQLEALISRTQQLYPRLKGPKPVYNKSEHVWTFYSGAQIFFGYLRYEDDKYNYQGKPYDFIAFDELTQFTYSQYSYLMSRNRPTGPGTIVYMRATANPGGKGHGWVKDRFITPAPPMTPISAIYKIEMPDGSIKKLRRKRIFVPSSVFDNQKLLDNDPMYLATLASLPEAERKALLYGDWDSFSGQVFTEWRNDPEHYRDGKWTHVIEPFQIPKYWKMYRGFDFGFTKPFSVGWYAVDTVGKIYRVKEYYGCTGEPNVGLKIDPLEMGKRIRDIENNDPMLKGRDIIGIADPSIFDRSRGESVADIMEKAQIYWNPGDNTRIPGKMQYHYRLSFDEDGECLFQVFNTCKHFIRTFPSLVYDESNVEDVNTEMEDHIYDEGRYVLMENPISPKEALARRIPEEDPLDLFKELRRKR